mgnify:CR=1 FL=1
MALLEIKRACQECEKTREALRNLTREVDAIRLDYQSLYEKVRTNLAKLAKRADEVGARDNGPDPDPLAAARAALVQRKLGRRA